MITLTTSVMESEQIRFMHESTNQLYICYMIAPVSVYPTAKGGHAA